MLQINNPEKTYLEKSLRALMYQGEEIPAIEVDSVYQLGKLTALTFIDWVSKNPDGVIALPTGKTPELFIKFLNFYKLKWNDPKVQQELKNHGIQQASFPDTSNLKFVQLDEFYPIASNHKNSFIQYVKKYYLNILNIKPENALLINISEQGILKEKGIENVFPNGKVDLTLLQREAIGRNETLQKQALKEAAAFCKDYEEKVNKLGGIGFFLGGIGYDGHVAFNQPGSSLDSETRLVQLNYPSSAQSAVDLGGMHYSRNKTAITIGLKTITSNPNAKIIITAAGEVKAPIIQKSIESKPDKRYPISQLPKSNTLFYLTKGAASQLTARKSIALSQIKNDFLNHPAVQNAIIEIAIAEEKSLLDLTASDLEKHLTGQALLAHPDFNLESLKKNTRSNLIQKIDASKKVGFSQTIMHTAPHHDDIMLSYYGYMPQLLKNSQNYFVYVTSGFNSVTDHYILGNLRKLNQHPAEQLNKSIFNTSYQDTLDQFANGKFPEQIPLLDNIDAIILGKKIVDIYQAKNTPQVHKVSSSLANNYFRQKVPGQMDDENVKILKGAMRESEVDRLWRINHVNLSNIFHMRSKFYTGEDFNPLPTIEDDAKPIYNLLEKLNPSIVTVALDPEGTGPDTHYKVLQVVAQALKLWDKKEDVHVWGYRNVWYRFNYAEANRYIPISEAELAKIDHDFTKCFYTQKEAEFPSPYFDGRFSQLSVKIQKEQAKQLRVLLGDAYFDNHFDSRIKNAVGFLLFKDMTRSDFLNEALSMQDRYQLDSVFKNKA